MSKLHTTFADVLFPKEDRKHEIEHLANYVDIHGCHGINRYGRVLHSRDDITPAIEVAALDFLAQLYDHENPMFPSRDHPQFGDPIIKLDQWLEYSVGELPNRLGWIESPTISKEYIKPKTNDLNHGKSKQSGEQIIRAALYRAGYIGSFHSPISSQSIKTIHQTITDAYSLQKPGSNTKAIQDDDTIATFIGNYGIPTSKK